MNKRIKLKKGYIFKKCNAKHCAIFRLIIKEKLTFNMVCSGCIHKSTMDKIIRYKFKDIKDTEFCQIARNLKELKVIKTFPYMKHNKCLGLTNGEKDYIKCANCEWHYKEVAE